MSDPLHAWQECQRVQSLWAFVSFFHDDQGFAEAADLESLLPAVRTLERKHVGLWRDVDHHFRGVLDRDEMRSICGKHGLMWGIERNPKLQALFAEVGEDDQGRLHLRKFMAQAHQWWANRRNNGPQNHHEPTPLTTVDAEGTRWMSAPSAVPLQTARHNLGETMMLSDAMPSMLSGAVSRRRSPPRGTSPQTARARLQHDRRSPTPPYGPRTSMSRQMKVDSASASGRRWATVVEEAHRMRWQRHDRTLDRRDHPLDLPEWRLLDRVDERSTRVATARPSGRALRIARGSGGCQLPSPPSLRRCWVATGAAEALCSWEVRLPRVRFFY